MQISQADPEYRPVTIILETQDDFDKFDAIVRSVAANKTNYDHSLVGAAKEFVRVLEKLNPEEQ